MPKDWFIMYSCLRWTGKRPRRWLPMGKCRYKLLTAHWKVVIDVVPFRGQFIVERQRRALGLAPGDGEVLERRKRPDVKKVKLKDRAAVRRLASLDSVALGKFPAVLDSIALLQYDDGSPRQSGYLGVWIQGTAWVVRLTDKDAEATLTCEGKTVDEALDLLNLLLGADDAPWEPISRRKKKGA